MDTCQYQENQVLSWSEPIPTGCFCLEQITKKMHKGMQEIGYLNIL